MALHDLQIALGMMVVARASQTKISTELLEPLNNLNLTAIELTWLEQLVNSPGFEVTCYIQKWWRQTRLQSSVKLTLAILGHKYTEIEAAYFAATACKSLFFLQEALDFLDFVIQIAPPIEHLDAVARFERAMLMTAFVTSSLPDYMLDAEQLALTQKIRCHQAASIVELTAPPEILLSALLFDNPLPPLHKQRFPLLIAPGLPQLWRPATLDEVSLFAYCQPVATVENLLIAVNWCKQPLNELLNAGAFYVEI